MKEREIGRRREEVWKYARPVVHCAGRAWDECMMELCLSEILEELTLGVKFKVRHLSCILPIE